MGIATFMWTGRWRHFQWFLEAPSRHVRADFLLVNKANSATFMKHWFAKFGKVVGIDVLKTTWKLPRAPYFLLNATVYGCKCNVLILCFEHIRVWRSALKRFIPHAVW